MTWTPDLELQAEAATVCFDQDEEGLVGTTAAVARLEAFDAALDYAIVRLRAGIGCPRRSRGWRIRSTSH